MPISADRLQPAPLKAVTIEDRFWRERIRVNRETTIPIEYQQCLTTGRIKALTLAQVPEQHIFWDSDVAKWIEAAAYRPFGTGAAAGWLPEHLFYYRRPGKALDQPAR
jgi:DUF1680 family protein